MPRTARMRMGRGLVVLLLLAFYWTPWVGSITARVVDQSIRPSEITVGTPVSYEIRLDVAERERVLALPLNVDLAHLEVDTPSVTTAEGSDRATAQVVVTYPVRAWSPGKHTLPAAAFRITSPDGSESMLNVDPISFEVQSVLSANAKDILGIRPVLEWHESPWPYWLSGTLLLVALLAVGYWCFRRRRQVPEPPPPPPKPAHVRALEALAALEQENLLAQDRFIDYFTRLSGIVRAYLEERYHIPAQESTTTEVFKSLAPVEIPWEQRQTLQDCLFLSDMVKFARYLPPKPQAHQQLEQMQQFVRITRSRASTLVSPDQN